MMKALAVLWVALLWAPIAADAAERIDPQQAFDRLSAGEIVLIDIRDPSEWEDTGVPKGAVLLSMYIDGGLEAFIGEIDKTIGREKPIALICASGGRSRSLQWRLGRNGLPNTLNVTEGVVGGTFTQGWKRRGLPMEEYDGD